jgi:hypothetical protein
MAQQAHRLVRILNDFNKTEDTWSIVLHREHTPPEVLVPGTRVFVYEPGQLEGIGIVQRGRFFPWVAQMIVETIRSPGDEGYTDGRGPDPDAPADDSGAISSAPMKDGQEAG